VGKVGLKLSTSSLKLNITRRLVDWSPLSSGGRLLNQSGVKLPYSFPNRAPPLATNIWLSLHHKARPQVLHLLTSNRVPAVASHGRRASIAIPGIYRMSWLINLTGKLSSPDLTNVGKVPMYSFGSDGLYELLYCLCYGTE
jgi:hypothetical protein